MKYVYQDKGWWKCLGLCLNHTGKDFRPDTGLAEWAGLKWFKFHPSSAFSVFHLSPHTPPGSGTSGGIKDMQILKISVTSPGEEDWPTCQVLWKSACYKLKRVNTLKQQCANMLGIPHPLHEIISNTQRGADWVLSVLTQTPWTLVQSTTTHPKIIIIRYNAKLLFLK